jgi:uncharacterized membrane protein
LWLVFYIYKKTTLLRISMPKSASGKVNRDTPFSLATVQMFFWWIIVIASIVFLYIVTGVYMPIPSTVLGIIGVSTLTNLGAKTIDDNTKRTKVGDKGDDALKKYESIKSISFWKDLIQDGSETASLTRVQNVVWTLLFGLYYIIQVYKHVAMPDIDVSMLVMMGLASGAYVGAKITEPVASTKEDPTKEVSGQ